MFVELDKTKIQLDDLIQTALGGEEVVIIENGEPILRLVRVQPNGPSSLRRIEDTSSRPRRRSGSAKGLISMSDDFDEPLDDFANHM